MPDRIYLDRIYLDHAATTPLRPEAKAAMEEGFRIWANPSSPHAEGRKARAALEDARERVKAALGWEGEVIFTSGASEAAAIALGQARGGARLVSAVEHDAILQAAPQAVRIPVSRDGTPVLAALTGEMAGDRPVVAIQHVNSETGNRIDMEHLYSAVQGERGLLLVDCAQSAGKFPLPSCDMAIVSAHKFGGPIGIGALLVRDFGMLVASGGQERGYRRGTENLPAAVGMAAALEACEDPYLDPNVLEPLEQLASEVRSCGGEWLSDRLAYPTPYISAIGMPHMSAGVQLVRFDAAGISFSQGSACSSGTMKRSHVLEALAIEEELADRIIRVSAGWSTTRAEVERFADTWLKLAKG